MSDNVLYGGELSDQNIENVIQKEVQELPLNIKNLKPIESKGIDLTPFEGQRKVIEKLSVIEVPSKFHESGKAIVLKVETEPVTTLELSDGTKTEFRASELFNLTKDENGNIGWSDAPNGALNKFLKRCGVSHPKDLVGIPVVIRKRVKETKTGTKEYLGFITD